jgi:hypothetical protein
MRAAPTGDRDEQAVAADFDRERALVFGACARPASTASTPPRPLLDGGHQPLAVKPGLF